MASNPRSFEAGVPKQLPLLPEQKPRIRIGNDGRMYQVFGGGTTDWFGPGNPIAPVAPSDQAGRQWDYPVALNQNFTQRGPISVPYEQLRNFARYYDLARVMIERRKGQIAKLEWSVQPRNQKQKRDKRCDEIENFLRRPDGKFFWGQWIRKLLEDMIVCDAATIYPRYSVGGKLLALDTPDGTTFKLLIDEWGRTPDPPWPAYQQVIKGVPATNYTADELFFMPFNPTNDRLYGYGLIEQVVVTITMALNNQASQLQYFTDGSTPDMILSVPSTWTPQQIKEFKSWWDATLQGNLGARRGTMFVFDGTHAINTKEAVIKTPLDEWIARIMCFCFGMSPAPFVATMNRATAEAAAIQAKEEGIGPTMDWVRAVMDYVVANCFKATDLCFRWQEEDETDPKTKADTNRVKFESGVLTINEWREMEGFDPFPDGNEPMIVSAAGATLLKDVISPPEPPPMPAGPEGRNSNGTPPQGPVPAGANGKGGGDGTGKVMDIEGGGGPPDEIPFDKRRPRTINPTAAAVAAFAAKIHPHLRALGKSIARQIASRLGKASGSDVDAWLSDLDFTDLVALAEILDSGITSAADDGFIEAAVEVGADLPNMVAFGLPNTRAQQYASERAASLIGADAAGGELADATRMMIRATIINALEQSYTVDELEAALESDYAFSSARAETIAMTELKNAMSGGNIEAWRASGVVTHKVWQLSNDHPCCDICDENADAGEIPIDQAFPSGDDMPGAHPNCQCVVYPVVREAKSED